MNAGNLEENEKRPQAMAGEPPGQLSSRGRAMVEMAGSLYYKGWEAVTRNEYNATSNPEGCIQLGLADNQLSYDLLEEKLATNGRMPLGEFASYSDFKGVWPFREAIASVMTRVLHTSRPLDPAKVITCAGATAMVEMMAWSLGDPGDAFIVPAPYYPGFDVDIGARSGVEIIPAPSGSAENFGLSLAALEAAFDSGAARGKRVRAVLLTSPSNPLGRTFDEASLKMVIDFCRDKGLHLISDEIYAGSVYGPPSFTSVLEIMDQSDAPFVHVVYGLAKDFGIPGFRLGVCYSANSDVLAAVGRMCRFSATSTETQRVLLDALSDPSFVDRYCVENKRRLSTRSQLVVNGLKAAGIVCAPNNAGLFVWANLSHLMSSKDFEGEANLFLELLSEARVNISPGQACHSREPGWFRVCFACVSEDTLRVAMHRIQAFGEQRMQK